MRTHFDPSGTSDALRQGLDALTAADSTKGILILGCDANAWRAEEIETIVGRCELPVFGGLFPQIIHRNQNHALGTLLLGLECEPEIAVVNGLSDAAADFEQQVEAVTGHWSDADGETTMLVFVDGLSTQISALLRGLFMNFGLANNFIGGGAGSLSFEQTPCIIGPSGLIADSAILARLPVPSRVGVTHGWRPISDPIKVTSSCGNLIKTLGWEPAFDVYKRIVEAYSGQRLEIDNFFALAKSHPFGITKIGTEIVVRDPVMVVDGTDLVCVGEVPEGGFVRLLEGTPQTLLAAAREARELAVSDAPADEGATPLFIDCISRVLFLGDRILDELQVVGADKPVDGAFTLGEIANTGDAFLELYNKTSVFSMLCDRAD